MATFTVNGQSVTVEKNQKLIFLPFFLYFFHRFYTLFFQSMNRKNIQYFFNKFPLTNIVFFL